MAKIKYDVIPPDALIDIQISGAFYRRMVDLLTMLGESVPLADFKVVLDKLSKNNLAEDMFEHNVHTIVSLIYEVEKKATEQKKTKEEELEVPDEPAVSDN